MGVGSVRVFGAGDLATKGQLRWLIIGRMYTQSRREYLGHDGWYNENSDCLLQTSQTSCPPGFT